MIKEIIKGLVGNASEILDEIITTKEEKLEAKRKIKELILNHRVDMEKQISERWKADMASDSWLSKNVRPMTLIFVLACTMLLIFIDAGFISFDVESKWVDLLQLTVLTIVASYFGGRSIEKVRNKK